MAAVVKKFQAGFRLMDGSDINAMVAALNNMQGHGTPGVGTFSSLAAPTAAIPIQTGAVNFTGAVTQTGGSAQTGRPAYSTVPIGSVAYASFGADTVTVIGTVYWAQLFIPRNMTITNINVLQGTITGTDKLIGAIYGAAGGAALATSSLTGVTVTSSNTALVLPLTATLDVIGPGLYWIAVQSNGNTDKVRMVAASTFIDVWTKSATGVFATIPSLSVPSSFTANVGPIAFVN